jgi:hypothetical protein
MMDITLGGLAFFCLIAAHFLAVVAVHNARWEGQAREPQDRPDEVRTQYLLNFGG